MVVIYEASNDDIQRHFVYFIVAICSNTLKVLYVSFYTEKQSEIVHSYFFKRHPLNTKKKKNQISLLESLSFSQVQLFHTCVNNVAILK